MPIDGTTDQYGYDVSGVSVSVSGVMPSRETWTLLCVFKRTRGTLTINKRGRRIRSIYVLVQIYAVLQCDCILLHICPTRGCGAGWRWQISCGRSVRTCLDPPQGPRAPELFLHSSFSFDLPQKYFSAPSPPFWLHLNLVSLSLTPVRGKGCPCRQLPSECHMQRNIELSRSTGEGRMRLSYFSTKHDTWIPLQFQFHSAGWISHR